MSSAINSPQRSNENNDEVLTNRLRVFLLPVWVFRAFTAEYPLVDLHDYSKLRDVLSIEDVAHLEIIRRHTADSLRTHEFGSFDSSCFESFSSNYDYIFALGPKKTAQQLTEITASVNLLVETPSVVEEATARFTKKEESNEAVCEATPDPSTAGNSSSRIPPNEEAITHCRVLTQNSVLYIIMEEGFLSYIDSAGGKLAFLTQVLKAAYAVLPVRFVNRSLWYKHYLQALAA